MVKSLGERGPVVQSMLWIMLASMQMSYRDIREAKSRSHSLSSKAVALGVKVMPKVKRAPGQAPYTSLALLAMYASLSAIFAKS